MLFVLNSLSIGGSELKIIRVANALAESGTRVSLAYLNAPETALPMVHPAVSNTHLNRSGKYSFKALKKLRCLLSPQQTVLAVNLYPLLYVIPSVKLSGMNGIKTVGLVNTPANPGSYGLPRFLYSPLLRRCNAVVFGSMTQRDCWVGECKIPPQRARVIYNGVDQIHFSAGNVEREMIVLRETLEIPKDALVVGSVGRLAPEKGYDLLILAASRLREMGHNIHLIFSGDGRERARLENLANSRGIGDFTFFLGYSRDVRPVLSMLDIFVLPSTVEIFSNAALEAMAMARPVLLSDSGGAAEMLEHERNGLLFPPGDVDALTALLERLCKSSELRVALGTTARQRLISLFDFDVMVERYRELCR
jgi:glycosyltransferase involved in cell wall biosynthesis